MNQLSNFADLRGRTALVTGASRGIGLAVARLLAEQGVRVGMVARTEDDLVRAASGLGAEPFVCDVSVATSVQGLSDRVSAAFGGAPDFLVNSAGSFALAPVAETSPAEFDLQLAVNLRAPFYLMRAFLPDMLARGSGHLLSVGSVAGRTPFPGNGAYSASKFGLRGLHEVLAEELRGSGVRATLLEPAATDTTLWDRIDRDRHPGLPPREAMLTPEDVARAVAFVLSQPQSVEIPLLAIRASR